jgi:hypothetical protein
VRRIALLIACACAVALLVPGGAGAADDGTEVASAARLAKPAPERFRVAYKQWRGRLKRHGVHVGRNLLASAHVRAAEDGTAAPTKRDLRRSIHRMQRRWARWLRNDPEGRMVAFKLKVRRQVPSWGKAHLRSIAWCESKNDPRAIGGPSSAVAATRPQPPAGNRPGGRGCC